MTLFLIPREISGMTVVAKFQTQTAPNSLGNLREGSLNQTDAEQGWKVQVSKKKAKKSAVKSQSLTYDPKTSQPDPNIPAQNPTPLLKPPVMKASHSYLWNAGGRRKQLPTDIIPPKIIVTRSQFMSKGSLVTKPKTPMSKAGTRS